MSLRNLFGYLRKTITWRGVLNFVLFEAAVIAVLSAFAWLSFQTSNIYVFTVPTGLAIALLGADLARINRKGVRRIGEQDWSSKWILMVFVGLGAFIAFSPIFA